MPREGPRRKRAATNRYVPANQATGPKRRNEQTRSRGRPSSPTLAEGTVQSDSHPEIAPTTEEQSHFDPQSHFDSLSQSLIDFGQQSIEDFMLRMEHRIDERLESRLGPSAQQPRDEMPTTIGSPQGTDLDLQSRAGNSDVVTRTIHVASHLDSRTRNKICQGEFIEDLRDLLPDQPEREQFLSLGQDDDSGALIVIPRNKKRKGLISLIDWVRSWNVFQCVLVSFMNNDIVPRLAKHYELIMSLSSNSQDWRSYDAGFRKEIANGNVQWGQIHLELLNEAKSKISTFVPTQSLKNQGNPPPNSCFQFQAKGFCYRTNCPFSHIRSPNFRSSVPISRQSFPNFRQPFPNFRQPFPIFRQPFSFPRQAFPSSQKFPSALQSFRPTIRPQFGQSTRFRGFASVRPSHDFRNKGRTVRRITQPY